MFANGDAYPPQVFGGVQSSTDQLARGLIGRGHEAAVFCALHGGDIFSLRRRVTMKLSRRRLAMDRAPGYPVYRTWFPWEQVDAVVDAFRPDVAVVQNFRTVQFVEAFSRHGIPCVVYLRNVTFEELGGNIGALRNTSFIANSRFTARTHEERFGIRCHVLPPSIDPDLYRVEVSGDAVVFINPHPLKGVDVAVEIAARCPDIPFRFVESWSLNDAYRSELVARLAAHPNITLEPRTSDMRSVYSRARLLLAPSQWEEAWGRVASEAHVSGIPVVGSRRGGLVDAIGPGGIVLDYEAPIGDWVAAVRSLWDDAAVHARLSQSARDYAARKELDFGHQLQTFSDVLEEAIAA